MLVAITNKQTTKEIHMNNNNENLFASAFLITLTRNELRAIAKHYGLKIGKSGSDTRWNIMQGIETNKVQFKITGIIGKGNGLLPNQPTNDNTLFQKKFRNYNRNGKNGGGDKVEKAIA